MAGSSPALRSTKKSAPPSSSNCSLKTMPMGAPVATHCSPGSGTNARSSSGSRADDCCLTVEGPIYRSRDGTGYPLGSQLRTEFGWLDLTPEETNLLADEVRSAIDLVLLRWFTRPDMAERRLSSRQSRERYFDDHVARNLILSATPPTASMEQDAHAK